MEKRFGISGLQQEKSYFSILFSKNKKRRKSNRHFPARRERGPNCKSDNNIHLISKHELSKKHLRQLIKLSQPFEAHKLAIPSNFIINDSRAKRAKTPRTNANNLVSWCFIDDTKKKLNFRSDCNSSLQLFSTFAQVNCEMTNWKLMTGRVGICSFLQAFDVLKHGFVLSCKTSMLIMKWVVII